MKKFLFFFLICFISCGENYSETEKNCTPSDANFTNSICRDIDLKAGTQQVKKERILNSINTSEINFNP
jgi:hypothetical protein